MVSSSQETVNDTWFILGTINGDGFGPNVSYAAGRSTNMCNTILSEANTTFVKHNVIHIFILKPLRSAAVLQDAGGLWDSHFVAQPDLSKTQKMWKIEQFYQFLALMCKLSCISCKLRIIIYSRSLKILV